MNRIVPWEKILAKLSRHYPKASPKGGRPAKPLEVMLLYRCKKRYTTSPYYVNLLGYVSMPFPPIPLSCIFVIGWKNII
ncbi:hypothetical protein [Candidatus Regiella insecticola]|uniref:hypothetical protein n=1 Tax=Candidatus Regiella insecticola TaxID=138073 RepID=UPI001145B21E|nr:hypothetical protein [Candidatus Regiella insecticola]